MSTAAVPQHAGQGIQTGTTDTMHAPNQSTFQSVCASFLSGFGIDRDQAFSLFNRCDITSFEPGKLKPQLLDLAAAAGTRDHECLYVSTPITTGRHHLRSSDSVRQEVISSNRERAKVVVQHLRVTKAEMVIDPTGLEDVPSWEQQDYHDLWVMVINRFVRSVVFVDDWQYSVGCTKEFGAAYRLALPIFAQDLQPLRYDEGLRLLSGAAREVHDVAGKRAPLLQAIAEVEDLMAQPPGTEQ